MKNLKRIVLKRTALALALPLAIVLEAGALTLVDNGVPQVAIWYTDGTVDKDAALDLAATIKLMSGATMTLKTSQSFGQPPAGTPAVVVGELAKQMGLAAPPATPSGDGYRIRTSGNHLLLAGETPASTFFATTHLLESFGCRWFFDNDIGTVIPATNRIEVGALDVAEAPDFLSRSLWGPNWSNNASWTKHNRLGGMAINAGHNWPSWFCTTDPVERAKYLTNVLNRIRGKGAMTASISPPDGTKYCQCANCTALDDPTYIEPSSGRVVVSDRFQEFYNFLGTEAAKVNPQAILVHYAYADYTLPPRRVPGGLDNLCVSIAPIRFCRVHRLGSPLCESRERCAEVTGGWGDVEKQVAWREYNYNLAETTVPISKLSIWKHDIPWLKQLGGNRASPPPARGSPRASAPAVSSPCPPSSDVGLPSSEGALGRPEWIRRHRGQWRYSPARPAPPARRIRQGDAGRFRTPCPPRG